MLTIRQLVPVMGNSVIVTSLIIGIFLLALALGYQRGGYYKKNYHEILLRNFLISAIWLGIGLSYLFIQLFFGLMMMYVIENTLIVLTIYLFITTAPIIYVLGQTVPITTNLIKREKHIGAISGKVLSLSTLGSFLGSVVTTLLLMNFLGVAMTVVINYVLLLSLIIVLTKKLQAHQMRMLFAIVMGFVIYILNVMFESDYFIKTNAYSDYQIEQRDDYREGERGKILRVNGSSSSYISEDKTKGFHYIEKIKKVMFEDLQLTNKDILVLGAGGFTLSTGDTHHNRFVYVDIDKDIQEVVKENFLETIKGEFVPEDARLFLNKTKEKFDVVLSDVYSNTSVIPSHLVTKEYFISIANVLKDNGFFIANIIYNPMLEDKYSRRVDNTIRSVFKSCMVFPLIYSDALNNILYFCPKPIKNPDTTVYTDDKNSVTLDQYLW